MKKICLLLGLFSLFSTTTAHLKRNTDILDNMRAIHIGGNWGRNPTGIPQQPEDYYQYLRTLNINWAAINIGLHVSNSMDATVEKVYDNVSIPTFRDTQLRDAIRGFVNHNINIMLTMAIETQEASQSNMPVNRWQFGDPNMPASDPNIKPENWPWSTDHPQYNQFIQSWWQSYTKEVVYFAKIAEEEGVKMFAVGAETDRLFRTRSGGVGQNNFKDYIKALVDSVRKYFSGFITYELHWSAIADPAYYGPGSDNLWSDAGLDVVGVSAYFKLVAHQPNRVLGIDELEAAWNNIFANNLVPLQNRNPGKKIVFHEFGYNDALGSPFNAIADEFSQKVFTDINQNGKDDGEEQQNNIFEAFYRVNENRSRLVSGTFLWDNYICSNNDWANSFGKMRMCSIRNKLAQNSIAQWYGSYTPIPGIPVLNTPANNSQNVPLNIELKWGHSSDATQYIVHVSGHPNFETLLINYQDVYQNKLSTTGLQSNKSYYWKVKGKNTRGESGWSQVFSFSTIILPLPPTLESPPNNAQNIPTTTEITWASSLNATSYDLQVSENPNFTPLFIEAANLIQLHYQLINLKNDKVYYWHVMARNNNGTSGWSQTFSFTTGALPEIPVLEFPLNNAQNIPSNLELKWQGSTNSSRYTLQIAEFNNFASLFINVENITATKYQVAGLKNAQVYYWHVMAFNNWGNSNWSQTYSFTTGAIPQVPELEYPSNGQTNISTDIALRWFPSQGALSYDLEVAENQLFNPLKIRVGEITSTTFQLNNLLNSQTYYWKVKSRNSFGLSDWSQTYNFHTAPAVSVEESGIPTETMLHQNYPNPFNPTTVIGFQLSTEENVTLKVYDLLGREIATLINGYMEPGKYKSVFTILPGNDINRFTYISSGIYLYRLTCGNYTSTKKMLIQK